MRTAWLDALRVYATRRVACVWLLGVSSGLPRPLVHSTLTFWLMARGVSLELVGLFALTSIPYTLKFLAAPRLDRTLAPVWGQRLGRRRGWLVWLQLGLVLCLIACVGLDPGASLWVVAALMGLVAVLSALQDVVIDALRIELLEESEQGAGAAAAVFGYRVGMLLSGAGALTLAAFMPGGWGAVYMVMGLCVAALAALTPLMPEPARETDTAQPISLRAAVRDLGSQEAAGWMLALVLTYKLGDALAGAMINPLLVDLGFDTLVIAGVAKTWGLGASLLGVGLGGWLVRALGLMRALWIGAFMQLFSNLVFVLQAALGAHVGALIATIGTENICGGVGTAAFVALLSSLCKRELSATQYALLTAISSLLTSVLTAPMGAVAAGLGWRLYFVFTALSAVPGLLILRATLARRAAASPDARRAALERVFE
jgi:PAT family beta-lactamase induction signal transducer AmpG